MNFCNPEGWKNEIKELFVKVSEDEFFTYFDGPRPGTKDEAFDKAEDIFQRLFVPHIKKYLDKDHRKASLDIGYGSGAQVLAASKYFEEAHGVDVHEENDVIIKEISKRGGKNIKLYIGDGQSLPMMDETYDFVHSWVTFLHFSSISIATLYLQEIMRVLKPGGIAVVFFSRMLRSKKDQTWAEVKADIEKEKSLPVSYREGGPHSKVRSVALQISMNWMLKEVASVGGKVVDYTASFDGFGKSRIHHGQYGVIFQKPKVEKAAPKRRVPRKKVSGKN